MNKNVLEDQVFLLRTLPEPDHPLGKRLKQTYREIMTGVADAHAPGKLLRFDYPLEYLNTAALGLCVALTQALFEPENEKELLEFLQTPLDDATFERAVAPLRDEFSIDGNVRFMQGPEPQRDAKGRLETAPLSHLVLSMNKRQSFLNRADNEVVVGLDQIPLFLFARSTYYEKSAGRGYITGTSGDLEIRTWLMESPDSDDASLRRSIWLNVLAQSGQPGGDLIQSGDNAGGYDSWMWKTPPAYDVLQGAISLRAGLFWMVANAWVEIEELSAPQTCIVTGEEVAGRAGTRVAVNSTGCVYGTKVKRDNGVEARDTFFLHPNAPYKWRVLKGRPPFRQHLTVKEESGLIGEMAGFFFSQKAELGQDESFQVAPVVSQFITMRHRFRHEGEHSPFHNRRYDLLCFGFHMLSSKQNIHGGYEFELYHYPIIGPEGEDPSRILHLAQHIVQQAAARVKATEKKLKQAIQMCVMKEVKAEQTDEGKRISYTYKKWIDDGGILSEASSDLWYAAGIELKWILKAIEDHGASEGALIEASLRLPSEWTDRMFGHALRIFGQVFEDYSASPTHIAAAHKAQRMFHAGLHSIDNGFWQRMRTKNQIVTTEE